MSADWTTARVAPESARSLYVAGPMTGLPDLLAGAWDEGKHSEHAPACRLGDGDCTCPNPYQPEGETHE